MCWSATTKLRLPNDLQEVLGVSKSVQNVHPLTMCLEGVQSVCPACAFLSPSQAVVVMSFRSVFGCVCQHLSYSVRHVFVVELPLFRVSLVCGHVPPSVYTQKLVLLVCSDEETVVLQ